VEGGLPIEQDVIAVLKVSLNDGSITEVFLYLLGGIVQFDHGDYLFIFFVIYGWSKDIFNFPLLTQLHNP
jgi:hypothetical protein